LCYIKMNCFGEKFYIIKWAFGGSRLYDDWYCPSNGKPYDEKSSAYDLTDILEIFNIGGKRPNAGWCYNGLISKVKESIKILESQNLKPEIRAFCWMQGESDTHTPDTIGNYINRYKNLIKDFKSNFSDYLYNCIYADAGISTEWNEYKKINQAKYNYAKEDKNRVYIDTIKNCLTTLFEPEENPDTAHYDSGSLIKLGHLFIDAIKNNLK
ncbi:MAG: sialate O-acetylesterase, partial [Clostridia bacterium]|nr:sialate O-acetylesterase [Clostridia bacterium]